ncbi:MAG: amidohydrolase family protein, partial [Chloroflexota bacterium]|nr:amidohydrolase family protein [Chloroflexota bacterium]
MVGIVNGEVYDPQNGINGEVCDIWIEDGKIVSAPPPELGGTEGGRDAVEIIDAAGLVVMPGGVDIHSHIVGAKVNAARKFRPEDHRDHVRTRSPLGSPFRGEVQGGTRSGSGYTVPTTYMTGYLYAEM